MDDEYRREYEPWAALDSSLDAVLRRHPRAREMLRLGAVQAVWAQAVGATVARAAQPVRLLGETLVVGVSSPAWGQTLTGQRHKILAQLERACPEAEVTALRVELRPPGAEPPSQEPLNPTRRRRWPAGPSREELSRTTLSAAVRARIEASAAQFEDTDVRLRHLNVLVRHYQRLAWYERHNWRYSQRWGRWLPADEAE